jgi:hypothetical protein
MLVLGTRKRYLPDNITKNTSSITLFLNYTISNLTNKLAIDAELSLINRTPLKLYV